MAGRGSFIRNWVDFLVANRASLPRFVNVIIYHVAKNPDGLLARVIDSILIRTAAPSDPTSVPAGPLRVFIGATNYAGQGFLWARALEQNIANVSARNLEVQIPGSFSFPADSRVSVSEYNRSRAWQNKELSAVSSFSHVLIEAERPIFGSLFGRSLVSEISALKRANVSVALMCHGTDVRSPSNHLKLTGWSPYADNRRESRKHQLEADKNIALIRELDLPTFLSTPDLLLDVPQGIWCPVVVDATRWAASHPPLTRRRPIVLHVPSTGQVKGTHLIEKTLDHLHDKGVIEYRPFRSVSSDEMPNLVSEADIVLDQFRLGSYGVAAVEAMSAGRVVIGHIPEKIRAQVFQLVGQNLPIVEATPDTLQSTLLAVVKDPGRFQRFAHDGEVYAQNVHDGRLSSQILERHWIHAQLSGKK